MWTLWNVWIILGGKIEYFAKTRKSLWSGKFFPVFRAEKISTSPEKNISPEFVDIVDSYS